MEVVKDKQIVKFGMYGFFKNLRFYEPFFLVYFIANGLSYTEIGVLYAIREMIIYIFEIPSGVLADRFGKKTELIICFGFYILSFLMFFIGKDFYIFVFAMVLYGFGEAFRSGTHKAMIMNYLDREIMTDKKSKVYGFTRSYSLIGSTVSSIVGAVLSIVYKDISYLFLTAIGPYLIDTLLILSYPSYMNEKQETSFKLKPFIKENILSVKYAYQEKKLRNILYSSAAFNAVFKTIKDYIQPIVLLIGVSYIAFDKLDVDENNRIYIGIIYAVIYLIGSIASRHGYKLTKKFESNQIIKAMWLFTALTVILISMFIENLVIVSLGFILIYIFLNVRKPLMVEKIGDETDKDKRASVLSIESQLTSIMIVVLAPLLGYISDTQSIGVMMFWLGILMLIIFELGVFKKKKARN